MDYPIKDRASVIGKGSQGLGVADWVLILLVSGLVPSLNAVENEQDSDPNLPDLEFLEFLGQFETDEGQWIDPGSLMADEFEDLLNAVENGTANDDDSIDTDNQ